MALRLTVILTVATRFAVRFHKIMNYLGSFSNEIKWPQATSHSEAGSQRIRWFPANAAASFKRVINSIRARRLAAVIIYPEQRCERGIKAPNKKQTRRTKRNVRHIKITLIYLEVLTSVKVEIINSLTCLLRF